MPTIQNFELSVQGTETRENLAEALRLIANALDGKGKYRKQSIKEIDGESWFDCSVETTIRIVED